MGHIRTTTYGEEDVLNRLFVAGGTPTGVPFTRICLLTSMSPVTECSGPGYSAITINPPGGGSPEWVMPFLSIGVVASIDTDISWTGQASWTSIVGVGLRNAAGNIFAAAQLPTAITMPGTILFTAGSLNFRFEQFGQYAKSACAKMFVTGEALSADESHFFLAIGSRPLYIGLFYSFTTGSDAGVEITGTAYARQPVTFVAAMASPYNTVVNSGAVTFPVNSGGTNWTAINYVLVVELTSWISGKLGCYAFKQLSSPVVIAPGQQAIIPAGSLTIRLD